jgi:hypothetical protein
MKSVGTAGEICAIPPGTVWLHMPYRCANMKLEDILHICAMEVLECY